MRPKQKNSKAPAERVVKDIRRATRKQYSAEEKIRIVLEGLRGEAESHPRACHMIAKRRATDSIRPTWQLSH